MSYEKPTPPGEIPQEIVERLEGRSPEVLKQVADYTEALAEYREREARLAEREDEDEKPETSERPEDLPDDVPENASITVKEINENRYYYWQWREGEKVKSKYKGPVNPDE